MDRWFGMRKHKASQKRLIRPLNIAKRLEYALEHQHDPIETYKDRLFSDEAHWGISYATENIIREKDEASKATCIQYRKGDSHSSLLHTHAFVGYNIKSPLYFYETEIWGPEGGKAKQGKYKRGGNIPLAVYEELIRGPYKDAFAQNAAIGRHLILLEDNDWAHGTRQKVHPMQQIKPECGVRCMANIPQSPDLNIIENCWRIVKQRIKHRHNYWDKESLKRAIVWEWEQLSQDEINALVMSMPTRMKQLAERQGYHTDY